jgi:hypothetical protein
MSNNEAENNPVAGIFDNNCDWYYPSPELCKQANIYPNMLAFCKARATLVLIVKRSAEGQDFALSEAGLLYLEATLDKGTLKDGMPVRTAFVVLADIDLSRPRQLKLVSYSSAEETRKRRNGFLPCPGKFGAYWWITADTLMDEDAAFL